MSLLVEHQQRREFGLGGVYAAIAMEDGEITRRREREKNKSNTNGT